MKNLVAAYVRAENLPKINPFWIALHFVVSQLIKQRSGGPLCKSDEKD